MLQACEAHLPDDWREQVAAAIFPPSVPPEGGKQDRAWALLLWAPTPGA